MGPDETMGNTLLVTHGVWPLYNSITCTVL